MPLFRTLAALALAGGLLLAGEATAAPPVDPRWALCPPLPAQPVPPRAVTPGGTGEATELSADQAVAEGKNRTTFSGNVVILRGDKQLNADQAIYDKQSDTVEARGGVKFMSEGANFTSESARMNLGENTGELKGADYFFPSLHAFGKADRVEFKGTERTTLKDASYTTCSPDHPFWILKTSELNLDRTTNTGEAYNVLVDLAGVPVFYLPYINFPLQGRKTGFLVPTVGSSERNGTDVSIPWYWNIAPNRDATITPRDISNRGGMLMTEFRYLNDNSSGAVNVDVLPNDKLYGRSRSYVRINHAQQFSDRWNATLTYNRTSDRDYLTDIDNTLASASTTHLERRLDVNYQGDGWSFIGRLQGFQPLRESVSDYERLPQLLATGAGRRGPVDYDFRTEYVNFESSSQMPTGSRVDLYPGISMPVHGNAWYFTPRVAGRLTQYDIAGASDSKPSRALPIGSIDTGVFFERDTRLFGTPLVQTLEPRAYYLYVPYVNQDNLPTFDTDLMTFSFSQLFRENRFTGADRMGDANQLTTALTTRFLSGETGAELGHASVGQIQYFADRRVTLPGQLPEDRASSDVAGELSAMPLPGLELTAATRWDAETYDAVESAARIRYRPDARHVLDAAWRYRNGGQEMNRDMLVLWPVTRNWHVVGRWYYDLVNERTLETVLGAEYESCCWTVRVVTRDKPIVTDTGAIQSDRSIYFTLELKGLASLGRSLASVIDEGMVGTQ